MHARRTCLPRWPAWYALFVMCVLLGCGGEEGPTYATVRGQVTLNGKPMQSGYVHFIPQEGTEGPMSTGVIDRNGQYQLQGPSGKGVVVGQHKVLVMCPEEGSGPTSGENPLADAPPCRVPAKYTTERLSPITKTVTEGENDIDIKLSSN